MSRGKTMFPVEKATISLRKRQGKTMKAIASELGRSPAVIRNYLKNPKGYGRKKNDERPSILTKQQEEKIISMAKTGNYFAREI